MSQKTNIQFVSINNLKFFHLVIKEKITCLHEISFYLIRLFWIFPPEHLQRLRLKNGL